MSAARFGFVLAATLGGVVLGTGLASAACNSTCSVGSDTGFHYQKPSPYPDTTVTNSGSQNSGHIDLSGAVEGSASGAFTPQEVIVGHYDGVIASDWLGLTGTCNGVCG